MCTSLLSIHLIENLPFDRICKFSRIIIDTTADEMSRKKATPTTPTIIAITSTLFVFERGSEVVEFSDGDEISEFVGGNSERDGGMGDRAIGMGEGCI